MSLAAIEAELQQRGQQHQQHQQHQRHQQQQPEKQQHQQQQQAAAPPPPPPSPPKPAEVGRSLGTAARDPLQMIKRTAAPALSEDKRQRETKPLDFLVQRAAVDPATRWRRVYQLGSKAELLAVVKQPDGDDGPVTVALTTDTAADVVLHWGVTQRGSRDWQRPPKASWPGSTLALEGGVACETVFEACDEEECDVEVQVRERARRRQWVTTREFFLPSFPSCVFPCCVITPSACLQIPIPNLCCDETTQQNTHRAPKCRCSASPSRCRPAPTSPASRLCCAPPTARAGTATLAATSSCRCRRAARRRRTRLLCPTPRPPTTSGASSSTPRSTPSTGR